MTPGAATRPSALTLARLAVAVERFEVLTIVATATLIVVAGAAALLVVSTLTYPEGCWDAWLGQDGTTEIAPACVDAVNRFSAVDETVIGRVMAAMAFFPFVAGVVLGVPTVGRGIEARTAALAWSLAPSRRRWLGGWVLPVFGILLIVSGATAIVAAELVPIRQPWSGRPLSFYEVGLYGPPVVGRAVLAFGAGVLLGAILGRTLPALIMASVVVLGAIMGLYLVQDTWLEAIAEPLTAAEIVDLDSGRWSGMITDAWTASDGSTVYIGVPGVRADSWAGIETVGLGALGLAMLLITVPVVDRRRPS